MNTIMTIAAGVAIGYFLYQYFTSSSKHTTNGRIHKSARDKRICGVCGGIAEYLNTDATLIRLAFVVIAAAAGTGILAYFLAALVMPEAQEIRE